MVDGLLKLLAFSTVFFPGNLTGSGSADRSPTIKSTSEQACQAEGWEIDSEISYGEIISLNKRTLSLMNSFYYELVRSSIVPSTFNLVGCLVGYLFLAKKYNIAEHKLKKSLLIGGLFATGLAIEKLIFSVKSREFKNYKADRFEKTSSELANRLSTSFNGHPLGTAKQVLTKDFWPVSQVYEFLGGQNPEEFNDRYINAHCGVTCRIRFLKSMQKNIELLLKQLEKPIPSVTTQPTEAEAESVQVSLYQRLLEVRGETTYVRQRSSLGLFLIRLYRFVDELKHHQIRLLGAIEKTKYFRRQNQSLVPGQNRLTQEELCEVLTENP